MRNRIINGRTGLGINQGQVINWAHPLNRGLQEWYPMIPAHHKSNVIIDEVRRTECVFNGGLSSADYTRRTEGLGAITFDGNDDYAVGVVGDIAPNAITMAAWIFQTDDPTANLDVINDSNDTAGIRSRRPSDSNNANFIMQLNSGYHIAGNGFNLNINQWYHLVGTYDGATVKIYTDGALGPDTVSEVSPINTAGVRHIGVNSGANNNFFPGNIADLRIHNIAWSADEVRRYYHLSRMGYPGLFNRVNISPAMMAASAGVTGTASASITEQDIVTGGKTIVITLSGDTWV